MSLRQTSSAWPLAGHGVHAGAFGAPTRNVPGGQTMQKVLALAVVKLPTGHTEHSPGPSSRL
eukprot:2844363-Rhodomonas_salina.4